MQAKRSKTAFVCNQCGQQYGKWQGKCSTCGVWDSVVEFRVPAASRAARADRAAKTRDTVAIVPIDSCEPETVKRIASRMEELDRVLGGGLVPGSVTLVAGEPGIGKSTLLLQLLAQWARSGHTVVYVTGEESLEQVSLRAQRLGLRGTPVLFLADIVVQRVCELLEQRAPAVVVVDSIQTMLCEELQSAPGSVAQVRESAAMLLRYAKQRGVAVLLVGHVTKDGAIAGPRLLEHMVDTVLSFEGDANYQYRVIRALKNRHGPSGEIALLSMSDRGLSEIRNAAELFMQGREESQPGSALVAVREGTRVLVVELQALVNQTHFGLPQRVVSGLNPRRLALLAAVLERHGGISLGAHDIFFNIAGGLTVNEPAIDLGVIAALVSSFRNRPLGRTAFTGEVGLGGEIRPVNGMDARIRELAGAGVRRIFVPRPPRSAEWNREWDGVTLVKCRGVAEAIEAVMG